MFSIKNLWIYISSTIIIFLGITLLFMKLKINSLEKEVKDQLVTITRLESSNLSLQISAQKQNQEITKHQIDLNKYYASQQEIFNSINNKYETAHKHDDHSDHTHITETSDDLNILKQQYKELNDNYYQLENEIQKYKNLLSVFNNSGQEKK